MIRVVVKEPGKPAEAREIENNLETFQKILGEHIADIAIGTKTHILIDSEGKRKQKPFNFTLGQNDYVAGTAIFLAVNGEGFVSLSDNFIALIFGCLECSLIELLLFF